MDSFEAILSVFSFMLLLIHFQSFFKLVFHFCPSYFEKEKDDDKSNDFKTKLVSKNWYIEQIKVNSNLVNINHVFNDVSISGRDRGFISQLRCTLR